MSAIERLLVPGSTELPACHCGDEKKVANVVGKGLGGIRGSTAGVLQLSLTFCKCLHLLFPVELQFSIRLNAAARLVKKRRAAAGSTATGLAPLGETVPIACGAFSDCRLI